MPHGEMLIAHGTLTSIAYFIPVIAFLLWLGVTQLRERRASRRR